MQNGDRLLMISILIYLVVSTFLRFGGENMATRHFVSETFYEIVKRSLSQIVEISTFPLSCWLNLCSACCLYKPPLLAQKTSPRRHTLINIFSRTTFTQTWTVLPLSAHVRHSLRPSHYSVYQKMELCPAIDR